jgi:hypothetical protein
MLQHVIGNIQLMVIFPLFVLKGKKENTWIPQSNLEKVEFLATL